MASNFTIRLEDVDRVFGVMVPLVDRVLSREYALSQEEAAEVEQALHIWFRGFVRRPGSPRITEQLRTHVVSMACQAAHVYWTGKLNGKSPTNDNVRRSLTLGPSSVAEEFDKAESGKAPEFDGGAGGEGGDRL